METQANDAVTRTDRLLDLRERYRTATASLRSQAAGLVEFVFEMPVLTARLVETRISVTRPTTFRLLSQLAQLGILAETPAGARRQRRWVAREVLDAQTKPV